MVYVIQLFHFNFTNVYKEKKISCIFPNSPFESKGTIFFYRTSGNPSSSARGPNKIGIPSQCSRSAVGASRQIPSQFVTSFLPALITIFFLVVTSLHSTPLKRYLVPSITQPERKVEREISIIRRPIDNRGLRETRKRDGGGDWYYIKGYGVTDYGK